MRQRVFTLALIITLYRCRFKVDAVGKLSPIFNQLVDCHFRIRVNENNTLHEASGNEASMGEAYSLPILSILLIELVKQPSLLVSI